jgi:hypothetical protein
LQQLQQLLQEELPQALLWWSARYLPLPQALLQEELLRHRLQQLCERLWLCCPGRLRSRLWLWRWCRDCRSG